MAIRGVYSEAERKMIEDTNKSMDKLTGWLKPVPNRFITKETITNMAVAVDYWNPLWRDEEYAQNTRWGGIIGPPMCQDRVSTAHIVLETTPECGFFKQDCFWMGEDWEFYKPVRVNDEIRVYLRSHHVEDITPLDGKGLRTFKFIPLDLDHVNQKNELVSSYKCYLHTVFMPERPKEMYYKAPEYVYKKEELGYLRDLAGNEVVRGAEVRYWEDVEIGEVAPKTVIGPLTLFDHINWFGGYNGVHAPLRVTFEAAPWECIEDPATGVSHLSVSIHLHENIANIRGFPHVIAEGRLSRQLMARLVTNWMGDDGFIKKYHWRYMFDTCMGDALIASGEVVNKRVENGEHLVDFVLRAENIRGNISAVAVATVSLCAREAPYIRQCFD